MAFITNEQLADLNALRDTFPFRIVYLAYRSGEWVFSAVTSKRLPNQLRREGFRVWTITGRGSLTATPCGLCGSDVHSTRNHIDMDCWRDAGGTLD